MRVSFTALLLAGCYSPAPRPGSPCGDGACPSPLVCSPATSTCEYAAVAADAPLGGDVDACTPAAETCGDGIDQDCDGADATCIANDQAPGAIDVTAGGTFTADLRSATDNVNAAGCGGNGGRDAYYSVTLTAPRVYYFDTFGSSVDTVVRVYAGACADVDAGDSAAACENDSCGGVQSQLAVSLAAGQSCIVIDQASSTESAGDVTLTVVAGTRDGTKLPPGMQTLTGDTTSATNVMDPSGTNCDDPGANGNDRAYFFTLCPSQTLTLDAETCAGASWDTVLYVRNGNTDQIGCNDDSCTGLQSRVSNVPIADGLFFWLVVDGFDATQSGAYTLVTNLR